MKEDSDGRRKFTPEQKYKVVKEVLTTDIGVSGASKKYGVSSALIYQWQEKFLEGAREGLERRKHGTCSAEQRKIDQLSKDNDRMKDVIAEITAENISFKKSFGDL